MIQFFKLLLIFLLGIYLSDPVYAQNNRAALIIGIEHYRNPLTAPSLLGVPADIDSAKQIAKAMGIPDKNVIFTRLDDNEDLDKNELNLGGFDAWYSKDLDEG